jgi:cellulose synthase/poly-beta-1,6-N-acetylglucosamine synthase-like glycosyltransferase
VFLTFGLFVALYVSVWSVAQLAMGPVAAVFLWRHQRRTTRRARALIDRLDSPPGVSIVVPAYNEALTIIDSVQALLALKYERCEIVLVNDGSNDATLDVLTRAFELIEAPLAFEQPLPSAPVRGCYRSVVQPRLVVIDKENGGSKADAANAGINAATGALVVVVDADTLIEPEAVNRAALEFLEDRFTIAVGGNVAITNGCRIEGGRITRIELPRSWLARFQIIEYMRSFMLFRLASASTNGVVIISGAFGMFLRSAVIAVGGFDRTAIGEDMDLTVRLQKFYRQRRQRFRIAFDPNPLGWTQAPEDWHSLKAQRCRWRRGLLQVLWRHRRLMLNPRFGSVGLGVMPYVGLFEGVGPLLEAIGYGVTFAGVLAGWIELRHWLALVGVSIVFGTAVTLFAVLLSDVATRRYLRGADLVMLVVVAIGESFGYRQLNSWWACVGTVQAMTGKGGWGPMTRRAF